MGILFSIVLALHFIGLAAIVGSFLVQMRRKKDFELHTMLGGAITQVLSGIALVGIAEATDHDLIYAKIAVKLILALVVLGTAIAAVVVQKKGGRVQPFFHAAGGLALVNILVAVFWH